MVDVAVIGGGLTGIRCALLLAEQGASVALFEAAGHLGGRTRSFFDRQSSSWLDTGPHLLAGAYKRTQRFLAQLGIAHQVQWQPSLSLTLFDPQSSAFARLAPSRRLPLVLALLKEAAASFGIKEAQALMRLALVPPRPDERTEDWLARLRIPARLQTHWLAPLHLAVLNAPMAQTQARSFRFVLTTAFSSHANARLGWFRRSLQEALIAPAAEMLKRYRVRIHLHARIERLSPSAQGVVLYTRRQKLQARIAVLAISAHARKQLLGETSLQLKTSPITSLYLWADAPPLPEPIIGVLGTPRWWLDLSALRGDLPARPRLFCAVASATARPSPQEERKWQNELARLLPAHPTVHRMRCICEHRATTVDAPRSPVPAHIIDASECPKPGNWPATIEYAIRRGEQAADAALAML